MSYKPPSENLPIFDTTLFNNANVPAQDLSDVHLNFPLAQGAETLLDTTIQGDLLANTAIFNGLVQINNGLSAETINTGSLVSSDNIEAVNTVICNTLQYQNLDPPISGVAENIEKILQNGNNAGGEMLENLGGLEMAGNININYSQIQNWNDGIILNSMSVVNGAALGEDTRAILNFYNNNGDTNYRMYIGDQAGTSTGLDEFNLEDETGQQYIKIIRGTSNQLTLSTAKLLYKTSTATSPQNTAYILDTITQPPIYKQIFQQIIQTFPNASLNTPFWLMAVNIYEGDTVFNYGINFCELLIENLQINITSTTSFGVSNDFILYLGNSSTFAFDPTKGNKISFTLTDQNGTPNYTYNSSIPLKLYYQNGDAGAEFQRVVLLCEADNNLDYTIQLTMSQFLITSYISGKNSQSITFNN